MLRMSQMIKTMLPRSRAFARPAAPLAAAARQRTVPTHKASAPMFAAAPLQSRSFQRAPVAYAAAEAPAAEETYEYQAEVDRLMDMIVNSLYSNKEVFLRELISNASDALDKVRIQSLTDGGDKSGQDLEVRIKSDKTNKTITIEDTGIGMTKDELLDSLGTIARSGTAKFAEAMKQAKTAGDSNLIGQFGVGFYSSFLVADRVRVQSKSDSDEKQWAWESSAGSHQYSIKEEGSGDLKRGTRITLHIKEDAEDLLEDNELNRLIRTYSEFISFPIRLWTTKQESKQVEDTEATKKKQEEADKAAEEKGEEKKPVDPVMKTEYESVEGFEQQNKNRPIWTRSPKEVDDEEYNKFFTDTFREFVPPMERSHFTVEGTYEFQGLLFIPGMAPFDAFQRMEDDKKSSIRLFVKRVFISDQFDEQLLPRYLGLIKGIVDSSDLPLNVSREILQESRVVRVIKKQLVKRCLDMMFDIAKKGEEEYEKFWSQFGRSIKLGIVDDQENKAKLSKLLRYKSSKSGDVLTGLEDYVKRMKESQTNILYIATESEELAANSPFVEALTKKDVEVLYFTEPIDEWTAGQLGEFDGKKLVDVTKEGLDVDEDDKKKVKDSEMKLKTLIDFLQEQLKGKVSKVSISARLTDSPCILVTSKTGWSANMQRIMKSQPMGDSKEMDYMKGDKILELNPDHGVITALHGLIEADKSSEQAKEIIDLMYHTALLTSGFDVDSPKQYANQVYGMMGMALSSGASPAQANEEQAPSGKDTGTSTVEADQVIEEK